MSSLRACKASELPAIASSAFHALVLLMLPFFCTVLLLLLGESMDWKVLEPFKIDENCTKTLAI